ncbi:class I SAM-dependent methyltransferase [Acidiplasma sp.]|uniref:class I SAM-dependent methyltransferase n=1 Tax=Acidiplasma sp. TaxID=1872114 RepID=UPI00316A513B
MGNIIKLLEGLVKSNSYYDLINNEIDNIANDITSGYDLKFIKKKYDYKNIDLLYEFAHYRILNAHKFSKSSRLFFDKYASMYSTPEIIGDYRGEKLKGSEIIDIGSGAGMQAIFFSKYSHVTGIEIDRVRYLLSLLNKRAYNSDANFINNDAFNDIRYSADIIFSDPLRPAMASKRKMDDLIPNPEIIMKRFNPNAGFVFDLPPQMRWENIGINGEREYISVNGYISRLTLYTMNPEKDFTSAVMLPERRRITGKPEEIKIVNQNNKIYDYLYLPDISLIYSKLLYKAIDDNMHLIYHDKKRLLFTSNEYIKNFFGRTYILEARSSIEKLKNELIKLNAGKIFFIFSIDTSEYYRLKNEMEKHLNGDKTYYIFKNNNCYLIARKING